MIIYPAIDIKDGMVVRLVQGRFEDAKEYSRDPVATARHWVEQGAQWLHVVDLDGAQLGQLKNFDVIMRMARAVNVPIQTGGGIRERDDIVRLFAGGIKRVILGTSIIQDRTFLRDVLHRWPEQIAVSLDCRNGLVAHRGWTEVTQINAVDFVRELKDLGLKCLIYTDISRDGMLTGPNLDGLEEILEHAGMPVIASGGVADLEDIRSLLALEPKGLCGAITGKAIYEGMLDLAQAIRLCEGRLSG